MEADRVIIMKQKKIEGFTIIELLITVAIIGVIVAIAYPAYRNYVITSKRADAMAALMTAVQAVERFKGNNNFSYVGVDTANVIPTQVPVDGGAAYYSIAFVGTPTTAAYELRATPTGSQPTTDGSLSIDHSGAKKWSKGNKSCWPESGGDNC